MHLSHLVGKLLSECGTLAIKPRDVAADLFAPFGTHAKTLARLLDETNG